MSKDDIAASSGFIEKVQDKPMYDIFGTKQRIKFSKPLDSIGLFVPHTMMNNLECIRYTIDNLHLEYETVMNDDLANQITNSFSLERSITYEHVSKDILAKSFHNSEY